MTMDQIMQIKLVRFRNLVLDVNSIVDLEEIDEFLKDEDKSLFRPVAYEILLCILADESSTEEQLAFCYFILGQCYDDPKSRYMYFNTACDMFSDLVFKGKEKYRTIVLSTLRRQQYAEFQINLQQAYELDD
jgi:hypothetical protein